MELFDQIRKISFAFFIIVGLLHFLAGFFFVNGYLAPESGLVNRILFIPFVIAALAYGLSNFKYYLLEYGKDSKTWNYVFIGFGVVVFFILLAIELLVIDSTCPLSPVPCPL